MAAITTHNLEPAIHKILHGLVMVGVGINLIVLLTIPVAQLTPLLLAASLRRLPLLRPVL